MRKQRRWILPLVALWVAIPGTFIVGLIMIAMIPAVGMRVYNLFPSRRNVRETLRQEFRKRGLNPDWIDAIAFVESRWNSQAVNKAGKDGERGGAYGATQMTWKTLVGLGYGGTPESFLNDVGAQAKWSATYIERGNPKTFADAVAYWNAGVPRFSSLPANHMTRTKYWPKAEQALAYVEKFSTYVDGVS